MKRRNRLSLCVAVALLVAAATAASCWACDTALLVIDVQNVYVREFDLTTIDGIHLVDRLVQVIAQARAAGLSVIYVQALDERYAWESPELAIPEAIAPYEGDPVVWKSYPDAFRETDLQATLAQLGVRRLLVSGLGTTGCVDATVLGAIQHKYETWVLADAHSDGGSLNALTYYNKTWPVVGASVIRSDAIDYSAFGCLPATGP